MIPYLKPVNAYQRAILLLALWFIKDDNGGSKCSQKFPFMNLYLKNFSLHHKHAKITCTCIYPTHTHTPFHCTVEKQPGREPNHPVISK